jgi:serine/threonine-protein kinase
MDFGLAKLLELRAGGDAAATTHTARHWMTPQYAAPEQVRGEPATTLTDVYQLGGVLYELLAGRAPFAGRGDNRSDLARAILEEEPHPPSRDQRALRGDLDAIVLKALRKEPDQRYPSVQALADDVRRYLTGHPVLARRQSAAYVTRRFVRRHPLALAGAVALVLGVAAYTATVTAQRARVERALAQATLEAQKAAQVRELLLSMFEASEGGRAFTDTMSARALLRRGVASADEMVGQPEVRAELLNLIAQIYTQLGDTAEARALTARPTPSP